VLQGGAGHEGGDNRWELRQWAVRLGNMASILMVRKDGIGVERWVAEGGQHGGWWVHEV
jgi:hypothetical protein